VALLVRSSLAPVRDRDLAADIVAGRVASVAVAVARARWTQVRAMTVLAHEARVHPMVKAPRSPDWSPEWARWFRNEVEPLFHGGFDVSAKHRREWTRDSPLRFALTYLDHHLILQDSDPALVTFNEMHLALCRAAKRWREPKRWREAWVAPRGVGKSSWCFLVLPLWALAHGHRSYFMSFSADMQMATDQLANLRMELETNKLLRQDYPELAPRRIRGASNTSATVVANGGTIATAGLNQNTLGRKSGASRPDLIIMDDIEKMDESMSDREKRAITLKIAGSVIPMASPQAAIGIFGTTTSYGSVVHDVAEHARGRERVNWIANNEFTARIFPGVRIDPDSGAESSLWPERWALTETHLGEWLRRTPTGETPDEFKRNFLLDPTPFGDSAGSFWRPDLIIHRDPSRVPGILEHVLYLDVAVTTGRNSDETAAVIVGRHPGRLHATVEYAEAWKLGPQEIHRRVHGLVRNHPTVRTVIVENNQGGDLWRDVISPARAPLPREVDLLTEHVKGSKRDRVVAALQFYQEGRVFHAAEFADLERQMVMFPSTKARDDLVDSLTGALRWAFGR
jgi:phage terminase large subunit-like protein